MRESCSQRRCILRFHPIYLPYGEVDKVCIDEDIVRRSKLCIVLKKESTRSLFDVLRSLLLLLFFNFLLGLLGVLTNPRILRTDDLLCNRELAGLFSLSHGRCCQLRVDTEMCLTWRSSADLLSYSMAVVQNLSDKQRARRRLPSQSHNLSSRIHRAHWV
jgi:hypothetical protein